MGKNSQGCLGLPQERGGCGLSLKFNGDKRPVAAVPGIMYTLYQRIGRTKSRRFLQVAWVRGAKSIVRRNNNFFT
jgi:hypothetical protein